MKKLPFHEVLRPPALHGWLFLEPGCLTHHAYRVLGSRIPLARRIPVSIYSGYVRHSWTRLGRTTPRSSRRHLISRQVGADPDLDLVDRQYEELRLFCWLGWRVVAHTDLIVIDHCEGRLEEQVLRLQIAI